MNEKQKIIEKSIKTDVEIIIENLKQFELHDKVLILNDIRQKSHESSPFKNEPVDFVKWVLSDDVVANDYNPNKVAPPEMELLELSIINDGYTQPKSEAYEKYKAIKEKRRISSELPDVFILTGKNSEIVMEENGIKLYQLKLF